MFKNLENYLEEVSHFLSGRKEREEILAEIRSHILEKAGHEAAPVTEGAMAKIIAAYGKPRQVAEKYLDGRPVIAPAYTRHLFRYATLLFAIHLIFIALAVIFKQSFIVFPFLFIPRLGIIGAVMYLPAAFLGDFGIVALVLYFITQSGKEFRLPWPKFALDLDELKAPDTKTLAAKIATMVGAGIMLALTGLGISLYLKFHSIFFVSFNFKKFQPLLLPKPGQFISLAMLVMIAAGTIVLFIKAFSASRRLACWVDAVADTMVLILIGLALHQPYTTLFAIAIPPKLHAWSHVSLIYTLLFIALMVAIDLVKNLVRLGRSRLAK
ncbi:MAG: hypothetical protein NTW95_12730 [Candidatus Aminicenantes bacterium]|nr:hypothetical protein [Candidatus Aminicenantes bacterium]